ncbi:MAG: DNA alkylation repair protein [Pirellulales bacterium]
MSEPLTCAAAQAALRDVSSPEVAIASARYFKTGPGEYGEGDVFIGVRVPVVRRIVRTFEKLSPAEVDTLLQSSVHEDRLLALLILVRQFDRGEVTKQKSIYELYLRRTRWINNWDLVDTSAPGIVGRYLIDKPRSKLAELATSIVLWQRRVAVVATQHFIRNNQFDDTLALCASLLEDREDLMHKACGWMLREVGARDRRVLERFLDKHARRMPRTMLRYAIEHFSADERRSYMSRD